MNFSSYFVKRSYFLNSKYLLNFPIFFVLSLFSMINNNFFKINLLFVGENREAGRQILHKLCAAKHHLKGKYKKNSTYTFLTTDGSGTGLTKIVVKILK